MKLIQFNGCKTLAVIIILLVLLIYYKNLFQSFDHFNLRLNKTETSETLANDTERITSPSKRIKRFLIFQGGGVVKLVFGTSYPIVMTDRKRSLNYFYNFQMQYVPPTIPLYWWSFLNTTSFAARSNSHKRSAGKFTYHDKSRTLIYKFLETILERSGYAGSECLLKAICELARAPLMEDLNTNMYRSTKKSNENQTANDYGRNIYHQLINAIFTPLNSNVDERYLNARASGQNGANCDETFGLCPIIAKLLKQFTHFVKDI